MRNSISSSSNDTIVKKTLLFLLLALILLGLFGPLVVGMQAEEVLHTRFEEAVVASPGLEIESESYSRGWFSSSAQARLSLNHPEAQALLQKLMGDDSAGPFALIVDSRIHHGPLTLSPGHGVLPAIATAESTITVDVRGEPLFTLPGKIYTDVGFSGDGTAHYVAPAVHESFPDGEAKWDGADVKVALSQFGSRLEANGTLGAFAVDSAQGELSGGPIEVAVNQRRDPAGFWLGASDVGVDSLVIANERDGTRYQLKSLAFKTEARIDAGKLDYLIDFAADDIQAGTLADSSAALRVTLERLDAGALANILRASSGGTNLAANLLVVAGDLQVLLAGGPELDLSELRLSTPDGDLYANVNLSLPPASSPSEIILGTALLYRLTGNATVRIPQAMVERAGATNPQVPQQIQRLVESGFLKPEGPVYLMEAAYQGGLLTLNGAPLPLPLGAQ